MDQQDAALVAHSLVEADLRGVHSHGVLRAPEYVRKLTFGGVTRVAGDLGTDAAEMAWLG